jgi:hypothetical protein
MKRTTKRLLVWAPRVLGILFALFISLFALDVLDAGYSFWEMLLALFMHLIPVWLMIIALILAWRWQWVGALFYIGFAVWYWLAFGGLFAWSVYLIIGGPAIVIGLLFLYDWLYRAELRV